jgi:hypothetical protein
MYFLKTLGFIKKPAFKPACQKTCANPVISSSLVQVLKNLPGCKLSVSVATSPVEF